MLPASLKAPLQEHLQGVKAMHERDLAEAWGRVLLPDALARKYPNAAIEWRWQWVFPQEQRWKNTRPGEQGRHHIHKSILQKAVAEAVRKPGLTKRLPAAGRALARWRTLRESIVPCASGAESNQADRPPLTTKSPVSLSCKSYAP